MGLDYASAGQHVNSMFDHFWRRRDEVAGVTYPLPSESHLRTLRIVALVLSTCSVASAALTFYWFVKMRRVFRHKLIMLLIQSSMSKSFWFFLYPVMAMSRGHIKNHSVYCQISGFGLSATTEAADFAVLLIAIHTTLSIFMPSSVPGAGGLYPYRKYAYAFWFCVPLIMAAIPFIHHRYPYETTGTYCYLPVRPTWYRLALEWVPRYMVFFVILAVYASIYLYVSRKFKRFNNLVAGGNIPPPQACSPSARRSRFSRPVSSAPPPSSSSTAEMLGKGSLASKESWPSVSTFNSKTRSAPSELSISDADDAMFTANATHLTIPTMAVTPVATPTTPAAPTDALIGTPPRLGDRERQASFTGFDMLKMLRNRPGSNQVSLTRIDYVPEEPSQIPEPVGMAEMLRVREKIRRQLRYLFIYPLFYIAMWIVPFVLNCLQYQLKYATNPPFALNVVATIFISGQPLVECWLFSTREKPWRHMPGSSGTVLGSLKFWTGWSEYTARRRLEQQPGKTVGEMTHDANVAIARREEEQHAAKENMIRLRAQRKEEKRVRERSWWEKNWGGTWDHAGGATRTNDEGMVGPMSPVLEEGPFTWPLGERTSAEADADLEAGEARYGRRRSSFYSIPMQVARRFSSARKASVVSRRESYVEPEPVEHDC